MALFFSKMDFRGLKYHFNIFFALVSSNFFDACRFGNGLLNFVIPKKFFPFESLKIFFGTCRFEILFGVCRFENGFVMLTYLVALKMIFCQLSIWKCFLALDPLKTLCRWSIREWFFWRLSLWKHSFDSCCIENIFGFCRYHNNFLASVASKIFLEHLLLKIAFWWMSLWIFYVRVFQNHFLVLVSLKTFWRLLL